MSRLLSPTALILFFVLALFAAQTMASAHPSYSHKVPIDTVPFYPDGTYDETVPKPNDYLVHPAGQWPARYLEVIGYLKLLAESSDRVLIETHGKTHEGRDLYNVFVGLPEYISNLEDIRQRSARLASAEGFKSTADMDAHIENLPAIAWMGYSIHGDEVSGVDAAVQLAYQLAAGTDSATMHLLENVVVIIDPTQNPDGRERYMAMLETYKSHVPNYDRQAQQHGGVWPYGRGNHYLFDLNRDWIVVSQPETEGRIATLLKWNPQLVVDAHEMGSDATYLFSPPRQPINYNTAENVYKWWDIFSDDQGSAFDKRGWPYYTKEWHEHWFPGYGSGWPCFLGVVGILYEQAGVDGLMVQQSDGYVLTYHEAINHQFTSSLANLTTLANNRKEIMRDYHNTRRNIVLDGERSGLTFFVAPDDDELKVNRFITSLLKQGIKVEKATGGFTVRATTDIYGQEHNSKKFPAGTYIIKTAQLHGSLVKAILDFDPHLKLEFLKEERRELEKFGDTRMYEVSAWSVPLAYNLDAYRTTSMFTASTEMVTQVESSPGQLVNPDAQFGYLVNMEGEKTYKMLNRLFSEDLVVRAAEKPFSLEGRDYKAGSLLLRKRGNPPELATLLKGLAKEVGIDVYGVNTGISTTGSFLGAPTFRLLRRPTVALVSGAPISYTDFGEAWFTIDRQLEIPHSLIPMEEITWSDLSRYNVLVLPSAWGNLEHRMGKGGAENLREWVEAGGTLICSGSSAAWVADSANGLSDVRLKRHVLDKLGDYKELVDRQVGAEAPEVDTMALWHPEKVTAKETDEEKKPSPGKEELEKLDEWQRRFHPGGTILKVDLDMDHWLSFGMKKSVPAMVYTRNAFMAGEWTDTPGRFSVDPNKLRVSGLLWPEARQRWAGTAYLTRENKGKGQIILFAGSPNVRAYFYGTRQLMLNAILYGPGMGTYFAGLDAQGQ